MNTMSASCVDTAYRVPFTTVKVVKVTTLEIFSTDRTSYTVTCCGAAISVMSTIVRP